LASETSLRTFGIISSNSSGQIYLLVK